MIQPLRPEAIHLIRRRVRDMTQPASRVVLENMLTCASCHSFSRDGRRFSMDVDGPDGDKGAHAVVAIRERMTIERDDVFSWNRASRDRTGAPSSGLFPRLSPDGRYVAATIAEEIYVQNYMDWRFLQTFYPMRGRIWIYDTATGDLRLLPGADDPAFVQSNPVWSPDGLKFIRAPGARQLRAGPAGSLRQRFMGNSHLVRSLHRVPFNGGKGQMATPIQGASGNGRSHSFPAFSPDGRWLAFSSKAFGYHTKLLLAHVDLARIHRGGSCASRRSTCRHWITTVSCKQRWIWLSAPIWQQRAVCCANPSRSRRMRLAPIPRSALSWMAWGNTPR